MPAIESEPRATEPLWHAHEAFAVIEHIETQMMAIIEEQYDADHRENWERYKRRRQTPASWRGHHDIYQYDRLMAELVSIVQGQKMRRVRLSEFLREHIRKNGAAGIRDVQQVMRWFKGLNPAQRQAIAEIRRKEEDQRKRDDPLLDKIRKRFPDFDGSGDSSTLRKLLAKLKKERVRHRT